MSSADMIYVRAIAYEKLMWNNGIEKGCPDDHISRRQHHVVLFGSRGSAHRAKYQPSTDQYLDHRHPGGAMWGGWLGGCGTLRASETGMVRDIPGFEEGNTLA